MTEEDAPVFSTVECSVASVTTAYNSAHELARHVDALLRQDRPLQEIVVVDNASSDETSSMLATRYPQVTVLRMAENLGTGGALAAGLAYAALEKRHDWVWMFDQDSVPAPAALGLMLDEARQFDMTAEVGILATLPVDTDMEISSTPWLWRNRFVKPSPELLKRPIVFTDLVITSGSMVRRDVVEKIGLPRSDFFIDFVDYEYCLRARSHGYKIAVTTRAKLYHEIGKARRVRFFLGRQHLWSQHHPFREYYFSRNLAYCVWWLYPSVPAKGFALLHLARHAVGVLLFGPERLACLTKMLQGVFDGLRASLGVRFLPNQ
ncbi:MAG: glycosyltransferase [Acidobacteria bacterium]|nr:glycosyltransferase [Acidobacteriota bacterium]